MGCAAGMPRPPPCAPAPELPSMALTVPMLDGSTPLGGGPMAGRGAAGAGCCDWLPPPPPRPARAARWISITSPLMDPVYETPPAVNEMAVPSTLPFSIATGDSLPPPPRPPAPSIVPVNVLPFWRKVYTPPPPPPNPPRPAVAATGSGLHMPEMPGPIGISCSQAANCGRSCTPFDEIVTGIAALKPVDVASTVISPAYLVDWTRAMHKPLKALRTLPRSDSWLVGSPLPVPIN